jgi:hypothetical protein
MVVVVIEVMRKLKLGDARLETRFKLGTVT